MICTDANQMIMKQIKLLLLFLVFTILACQPANESSQGEDFLGNVNQVQSNIVDDRELLGFFDRERVPIQPALQFLPSGSNRPTGWLKDIMANELEKGVVGTLDDLYPGIKAG